MTNIIDNASKETTLDTIISSYGLSNPYIKDISNKIMTLNKLYSTLEIDIDAMLDVDYSSLNGKWANGNGHYIEFENGSFVSDAKSFNKSNRYRLFKLPGDGALGAPITFGVSDLEDTTISFAKVGEKVGVDMIEPIKDTTDSTKDRLMITHGNDVSMYFTSKYNGRDAVFYKE